jgi:long-chain acyl-CoA synthetase
MMHDLLASAAGRHHDRTALITATRRLSYGELDDAATRFAAGLRVHGITAGDRVTLYSPNRWEWVAAYHGVLKAGAVVNPVNTMLTPAEVAFVVGDCGARALVTTADKVAAIRSAGVSLGDVELVVTFDTAGDLDDVVGWDDLMDAAATGQAESPAPVSPAPGDLCTIGYTSGTTGHPKGAMQSHCAVRLNCGFAATMHGRTSDDIVVTALPAPHVYGNIVINGTFLAGGTVVLLDRFDPGLALHTVAEHRATVFDGVPAMYAMALADPSVRAVDLSSLTRCTVGGQTMPVATMEAWQAASGAPLLELWGMTELAGLGTAHALYAPNRLGSIGVAAPGIDVRVGDLVDPERTCAPDEPGELMVRGPITMLGYYGNPSATADVLDDDGWLRTGDVAVVSDDGYFTVVDRRKDMILTGGYNVYPAEIERVLAGHPAVAISAVGPVADAVRGEQARAYVVLKPGASVTEQELVDHCRAELASYKLPRSVVFVEDLPRTSTGKVMRRELRKLDDDFDSGSS